MKKMSLANIEDKLSRAEMRSIMAGSGTYDSGTCGYRNPSGYCIRGMLKHYNNFMVDRGVIQVVHLVNKLKGDCI